MYNLPLPKKPGDLVTWGNLPGSSLSYELCKHLSKNQTFSLIITQDTHSAIQVEQSLKFFQKKHFAKQPVVSHFPDWETLPYDMFSPHQDIISQRIECLNQLLLKQTDLLIVPISTLMHAIADYNYIANGSFLVKVGDKFDIEQTRTRLQQRGYYIVNQVAQHGEYAIRGSIMDVYPSGVAHPFRIELFDNEVESIRTFDPDTQLSIEKIQQISLLPAREFPLTEESISHFRDAWRNQFDGNPMHCPIYQQVSDGFSAQGIEYYLPFFFDNKTTLFDYLPPDTQVIRVGNCYQSATAFWAEVSERYQSSNIDRTRPLLPPEQLFVNPNQMFSQLNNYAQIELHHTAIKTEKTNQYNFDYYHVLPEISVNHKANNPIEKLISFLNDTNLDVIFCAESAGRKQSLLELFQKQDLYISSNDKYDLTISPLSSGFINQQDNFIIITENELFGEHVFQTRRKKQKQIDSDLAIRNLAELQVGAPVVHIDHGVGRYTGLTTIDAADIIQEYLVLEFAGSDKLYVPVTNLHLVGRYSGMSPESAPLHRLGNQQWSKAKQKAAEKVRDVAAELLEVYAKREAKLGFAFNIPDTDYYRFSASFPFEETPDQAKAIDDVIADMQKPKPMDRLVCGDVGFGKTEVAMRAAFIAAQSNKQIAVLVPTTLLAEQHYQNFQDRFADWPINVACLSRFRTGKQQQTIINNIEAGQVDIVIGTHKLLQKDIKFHDLGLLIIDEEHRFGVGQKEKIKALCADLDIITLTATPIPRTLNMAMSGIRELSLIATPPAKRLSVKTFVHQRNHTLIREAILREILRGGQVYYLHNQVATIENIAQEIQKLVPEAKVNIAHGQMRERELERITSDFYHQRFNVLVCTTIIETGIDIPTANTIIIDDADHFGVAQLHQLRGRVGRSHHQAYAYLMVPADIKLTKDAKKRLEAVAAHDDLGVGFILATHDLEIRGAGALLGEEQSGDIQGIGFTLYMELLDRTVKALKAGKHPNISLLEPEHTEIDLKISALIPHDYLADIHQRLILYKRLASAKTEEELIELKVEVIDRFGNLPEQTKHLFQIHQLKLLAEDLGVRKVEVGALGGLLEFGPEPKVAMDKLIKLIQTKAHKYKLAGANRLRYSAKGDTAQLRIEHLREVLAELIS